jgi:hypothetical protein
MLGDVSQFAPGLLLAVGVGLIATPIVHLALRVGWILSYAISTSLAAILLTTLAPGGDAPTPGSSTGSCDLTRLGPGTIANLLTINEVSLNILLFVPLGIAIGLMPRSPRKAVAIVLGITLPIAIEVVQLSVPSLGRYCDSADVADNLTGLVAGLVAGTILRLLAGLARTEQSA